MQSLTTAAVGKAAVNATRSEIAAITFPRAFGEIAFDDLDFFGWRDPRIERRGYLVCEHDGRLVTVLLSTQADGTATGRKAMCSICRAVDNGSDIALFAARRAGKSGRKGDSVGTYICFGLDCSQQLRHPVHRPGRSRLADGRGEDIDARATDMLHRLSTFVTAVVVDGARHRVPATG